MTEEDRIERLVCEYGRMLVRLAASRLDSVADAEDAVQDVFCTLVSKKLVFVDPEYEKAWLIRATINRASDLRPRQWRRNVPRAEARAGPDDAAETERRGREMLACVRALPEKYAVVLHLHYYEGCGLREIGVMLRVPAATVGTRLARGRARLKALLEEESL